MTEREWLDSVDPQAMLTFLQGKVSDRKLRLFAVACCRRIWHLLTDERSRRAVEVAEKFADGLATREELHAAWYAAGAAAGDAASNAAYAGYAARDAAYAARDAARDAARVAAYAARYAAGDAAGDAERSEHAPLLREIVGNPFRPVSVADWLTPTVLSLARAAYDERDDKGLLDNDRLAVLADALEDARCEDETILTHLRSPSPHVRGCWVVDLLLNKT